MKVEYAAAYRFIFDNDLYLLEADKQKLTAGPAITQTEPVAQPAVIIETKPYEFNYSGKNLNGLLVLVHYAQTMDTAHYAALDSTLARIGKPVADVALVNMALHADATLNDLLTFFNPSKILILGQPAAAGVFTDITLNQPVVAQNIQVLLTYAFGDMMNDNAMKKAFWDQVKNF